MSCQLINKALKFETSSHFYEFYHQELSMQQPPMSTETDERNQISNPRQKKVMALQTQKSLLLLQLLSILLFLPTILSAVTTTISPGSTLYASNTNQYWSSPNNTFSLGFIPLNPHNSPPSLLAAIFYSGGIPIWSAGTTPVDSAAYFQFHPTAGDLRLVNGSGHIVWNSSTVGLGVSSASLDDHGNIVLVKNGAVPVWSSFDHPTDTIVPWQNFSTRNVLQNGIFSFVLLEYGNITLKWDDTTVYWSGGLDSSHGKNLTSPSLGLLSNGTLSVFDRSIPGGRAIIAYSDDHDAGMSDMLRFLRLDNDGNLRIYSAARGSGTPTGRWVAVEDQCRVFGYCGDMGICSYNGTSPICSCPSENFEQVDPKDSRKGCRRKLKTEDCSGNMTMLTMEHTLFLTYPPQSIFAAEGSQVFTMGISGCKSNCLISSVCDASTVLSDGTGMCYLKAPGFITGYYNPALPSTSYVKVCSPAVQNQLPYVQKVGWKGSDGRGMPARAVAAVVLGSVLAWLAFVHTLWWWWSSTKSRRLSVKHVLLEYASCAPIQFSYKELHRSTKGFMEKLGNGGFGSVYRGTLANRMVVAVKRLEGIQQLRERQFRMQVATISSTHHLNLVRLIGFCCEGHHRLLVYEFVQNKSLDTFLFHTVNEKLGRNLLSWESRFNIALGIARGITYLHGECRDCTVHCDIKPENILLDENYTAKVSDFGLAKLDHMHRTMTSVIGTRGYLAPEWLADLPLTTKSDVYSFGKVLLEIVSGRRNFEVSAETNWKRFSLWAYEEFEKGNVRGVLDRRLLGNHNHEKEVDIEEVARAIQVSFLCTQEQPSRRPKMEKVIHMLQGITRIDWPLDR